MNAELILLLTGYGLLALGVVAMIDGVTTYIVLQKGHREMNPVLLQLFTKLGVPSALVLSRLAFIVWLFFWRRLLPSAASLVLPAYLTLAVVWLLVAGLVAVQISNIQIIRGGRGFIADWLNWLKLRLA